MAVKNKLELDFLKSKKALIKALSGSKAMWTNSPEELVDYFMRQMSQRNEYSSMNENEREIFKDFSKRLDDAKKEFIIALANIHDDVKITNLISVACDLMNASYGLRGFLMEDWSIYEFQKKELAKINSEKMRKKKAEIVGPLVTKRREIIRIYYTKKLTGSEACAIKVIEKCRDKFTEGGIVSFSNRTIRSDIAAILKELPQK